MLMRGVTTSAMSMARVYALQVWRRRERTFARLDNLPTKLLGPCGHTIKASSLGMSCFGGEMGAPDAMGAHSTRANTLHAVNYRG